LSVSAASPLFQEDLYHFSNPILVILSKPWDMYPSSDKILLNKILTSVKIDMDAAQMVVQPSVDLKSLKVYSPARVLIFGSEINQDVPYYQATPAQGFITIRADDLSLLDDQKKKNLWIALRQMFGPPAT
jgi:hypothetical protein